MNLERMQAQLVLHEGERLTSYLDTEENWTIGVGFNVQARGIDALEAAIARSFPKDQRIETLVITHEESRRALRRDINRFHAVIPVHFPEYTSLDEIRQRVILDMAFNMGFRALGFKNTIAAIKRRDWSTAARELYKSKWARQVGDGEGGKYDRCERLSNMLLTGTDYTK